MQFGKVRKVSESDGSGEYDAVDLTMTRGEFRAFAHVVQAEVHMNPPKPEGDFKLSDLDRNALVATLSTAKQGRFRTVVTMPEASLEDFSNTLDWYRVEGAMHSLILGVDPTIIPDISQNAANMAHLIAQNTVELD